MNYSLHFFCALKFRLLLALLCWLALGNRGWCGDASSLQDDDLTRVRFDQKLNTQVSPDLSFVDENGKTVRLGDYFHNKPIILVLGYYSCPMLCNLVLNGLVECLLELKADIGKDFTVVDVSIDPTEKPDLANAKKRIYLKRYARHGASEGWHFLTGDEPAIQKLASEVGFGYAYDSALKQYAHPSGFIVLTPRGSVIRYYFGVSFEAKQLANTLRDAAAEKPGSPVDQLLLLCFHYNPLRGKYGSLILNIFRLAGLTTVAVLIWLMVRVRQRNLPTRKSAGPPARGERESHALPLVDSPKEGGL